jgi:hypothetical protein
MLGDPVLPEKEEIYFCDFIMDKLLHRHHIPQAIMALLLPICQATRMLFALQTMNVWIFAV